MDGRLALSRHRQDGRAADGTVPLTEHLLGRLPGSRLAWVLAWAAVPVAAGLLPGAYLATVGAKPLSVRLLAGGGCTPMWWPWPSGRRAGSPGKATWSNARWTSWRWAPSKLPGRCFAAWPAPGGRWRLPWCFRR